MKRRALHAGLLALSLLCLLGGARSAPPAGAAAPGAGAPLTLSPASGAPGTIVALSIPGGGLPANDEADVLFQDPTNTYLGLLLFRGMTGPDGSFNARVPMAPEAAAGVGRIFVNAAGNITTSAPFTVVPSIQVLPNPVQAGTGFQVVGNGFSSGYPITIQQDNGRGLGPQPLAALGGENTYANVLGNFTALLILDKHSPVGSVQISATDQVFTATASLQTTDPNALSVPPIFGATPPISGTVGQATGTVPPTPQTTAQTTFPVPPTTTPVSSPASGATATPGFGSSPTAAPAATPGSIAGTGTTAYFAEGFTGQATTRGQASFTESLNLLNTTDIAAPVTITYVLGGSSAPLIVSRTVGPRSVLREPVNVDVGSNREVAAIVTSPARIAASRSIGRVGADGLRLGGSTALPAASPSRSWLFPEGYTGYSFQEYLTLLNPGDATAAVRVQLAPQGDSARGARAVSLSVPPHARTTANIRALNAGSTTSSVGMIIGSDQPIVAERVEYFGDGSGSGKFGSTVTPGVVAPATALGFGYGSTGGAGPDEHYITLLNPATLGTSVSVTAAYVGTSGQPLGQARATIAPGTRRTIAASSVFSRAGATIFSVSLQASGPIAAEASQYYGGSPNSGTHPGALVPGEASASTDLRFADLSTTLSDGTPLTQTVYLHNPGTAPVAVDATYFGTGGSPVTRGYSVPAGGIAAVAVPGNGLLGAEFQASGPIIAYAVARTADGRAVTGIAGAP